MSKLTILLASALAFAGAPLASRLGVVGGSGLLVALGVLLAVSASGGVYALAIACGAVAALAGTLLGTVSPAMGGAVFVALAYAERTSRVRAAPLKLVHVGACALAGGFATTLASSYTSAPPAVRIVSIIVGAVLVALPMLVEADDPVAYALDCAASEVREPARVALRDAAETRRHAREVHLDRATRSRVAKTWKSLLKLANARVRLEKSRSRAQARTAEATGAEPYRVGPVTTAESVVTMLDERIADHARLLTKTYAAVGAAHAAAVGLAVGLDERALTGAEGVSESTEEFSKRIAEVR